MAVVRRLISMVVLGLVTLLVACGQSPSAATHESTSPSAAASPTLDPTTRNYVALVHDYWIAYKFAEGDLDTISGHWSGVFGNQDAARVCGGLTSRSQPQSVTVVDPAECGRLSVAMVAVHEKFLSDLNTTPAPSKFSADDQAFRSQLPKAIADMKGMISASAGGDKQSVMQATWTYADDMIPVVTNALNDVDPSFVHN